MKPNVKTALAVGLFALSGSLLANDIYVYRMPSGQRMYTDRVVNLPGYLPLNVLARSGVYRKTYPRGQIDGLIDKWAPHYALDPNLVKAVVLIESGYYIRAQSPANAQGLMQLIPATAKRFGVKNPWDPEQNLRGGMAYLQWLLSEFRGDLIRVLAAYNAGEQSVRDHNGVPPFQETRDYVQKINRHYSRQWHPYVRLLGNQPTAQISYSSYSTIN